MNHLCCLRTTVKSVRLPACAPNKGPPSFYHGVVSADDGSNLVTATTSETQSGSNHRRVDEKRSVGKRGRHDDSDDSGVEMSFENGDGVHVFGKEASIYVAPLILPLLKRGGNETVESSLSTRVNLRSCVCTRAATRFGYDDSLFDVAVERARLLVEGMKSEGGAPETKRRRVEIDVSASFPTGLSADETISWYRTSIERESRNVNTVAFSRSGCNTALMQTLSRAVLECVEANRRYTSKVTCTVVFLACDIFRRFLRLKFESGGKDGAEVSDAPPEIHRVSETTGVTPESLRVLTPVESLVKVTFNLGLCSSSDDVLPFVEMSQLKRYLTACMWIAHKMSTVKTHDAADFIGTTVRTVSKTRFHGADTSELVKNERHVLNVTQFEVLLPTACDFIMFFASLFFGKLRNDECVVGKVEPMSNSLESGNRLRTQGPGDFSTSTKMVTQLCGSKKRGSEVSQVSAAFRANRKSRAINETPRAVANKLELFSIVSTAFGAAKNKGVRSKSMTAPGEKHREAKKDGMSRSRYELHLQSENQIGVRVTARDVEGAGCVCVLGSHADSLDVRANTDISEVVNSTEIKRGPKRKSVGEGKGEAEVSLPVLNPVRLDELSIRDLAITLLRFHYLTLNMGCFRPSEIAFACVTHVLSELAVTAEQQEVHFSAVYKFMVRVGQGLSINYRSIVLIHVKMHKWTIQVD